MDATGTPSFEDLDALLAQLDAKLNAREVHALYLGALTSTNLQLGPQALLGHILGDEPVLGASFEEANAALRILFGYWNTLWAESARGRVRFAPEALSADPTRADLLIYATRRYEEFEWFVRGLDAGGDHPIEFGDDGRAFLDAIAEAGAYLKACVEWLRREPPNHSKPIRHTRALLLELVAILEGFIADLMDVGETVRAQALETFAAHAGLPTADGVRIARSFQVGRNEPCPCGSGKKSKKCCGGVSTLH